VLLATVGRQNLIMPPISYQDTYRAAPGRVLAGFHDRPPGYQIVRTSGTRDWLLTVTLGGQGAYRLGSDELRCARGDVVLLPPSTPHNYRTPEDATTWTFYWAHFTPTDEQLPWVQWTRTPEAQRVAGLPCVHLDDAATLARIATAFERCVEDNKTVGSWADALVRAALSEVLLLVSRQHARVAAPRFEPRVQRVIDEIGASLAQPPTVVDLAKLVALSPSRLSHLFKAQTGESILDWQMKLRLRHAARELALGSRSVTDIGAAVGFHSLFQFSRQFKLYYGLSPLVYRRQAGGGES
jgi:AraC family transcriptional regulator, arabinose operon regulatory protein